jgi:hypothetical protein
MSPGRVVRLANMYAVAYEEGGREAAGRETVAWACAKFIV